MPRLDFKLDMGFLEAGFEKGFIQIHGGPPFALNAFHDGDCVVFENIGYLTIYDALNAANEWYQDAVFDWYIECDGVGEGHFYYRETPQSMNSWVTIDKASKMTRKQAESNLNSLLCSLGRGRYWLTCRKKVWENV